MDKELTKGEELAKVLYYYNLIPDTDSLKQKIVCPFHNDQNPSMIVDLEEGSWFCFGCNQAGDAKRFVNLIEKKYNGLNDLKSYKTYLKILKSSKVSGIHIQSSGRSRKAISKDLWNEAHDYYYGLRTIDWRSSEVPEVIEAREYMKKRGFSPGTLNKVKAKVTYNRNYGLIFPMLDNGRFKGWVCRTMIKEVEQRRKYLYNEGFSRATTLVGDYGSKNYVFVVEGYMDRLKFIQYGVTNVVAILGWKMSDQQIQKLKDAGIKYIICALDNDECGRKGFEYLKTKFKTTRWCYLKGIKDPGDMSEQMFEKMFSRTMKRFREEKLRK